MEGVVTRSKEEATISRRRKKGKGGDGSDFSNPLISLATPSNSFG
jgi:hypothetical protein